MRILARPKNPTIRGVVALWALACALSSCAAPPVHRSMVAPPPAALVVPNPPAMPGPRQDIFHVVAPGETLWRIGRMYDVPVLDIARANHLSARPVLQKGDRLLVPGAAPVQPVISLYPSTRWKYIIIHHSATDTGDSLLFDRAHRNKGWDGVGYHFVIDNGSQGRADGQIEVSPRWLKQVPGAHCKADGMNERAIGICLVGNFNDDQPSARQMEALAEIVDSLRSYYHIPRSRILGHGQVLGAQTDCPGRRFPWANFWRKLGR